MSQGLAKSERLSELKRLYVQAAYSDSELAERLGVERSTIFRDRTELSAAYPFAEVAPGRYRIDKSRLISEVKLNIHEALALYLAARRASRQTRIAQPHAASALEKLAAALHQPMTARLEGAAEVLLVQEKDPDRLKTIETITQAWVEQLKVRIKHRSLRGKRLMNYIVTPYLIEPALWSESAYLIGHSNVHDGVTTFKIDRIESAAITGESFQLPADFDDQELLKHAWGIWYGDEEPVKVALRFSDQVTRRVKETIWHPSQTVVDLVNGGCRWEAFVAETQEMLPWIRGWGADCEVLEPEELRSALMREAQVMSALYGGASERDDLLAHIRKNDRRSQLLVDHLAAVSRLSGQFAGKIGLEETGQLLGLLHDLGKASKQFQNYLLSGEGILNPDADEYIDPQAMRGKIDHSTAGAQWLHETLWAQGAKGRIAGQALALCIASHHSGLIDNLTPDGSDNYSRRMGKPDADTHKSEALSNLQDIQRQAISLLDRGVTDQVREKLQGLREDVNESRNTLAFKAGLLVRFLLSCLIDADRVDTADFETPGNARLRNYGRYVHWDLLIQRLETKLTEFDAKPDKNDVDQLRAEVSQACLEFAAKTKGIYQLTVPTGGGKTLASLRFALHHAKRHSLDRIICVIPYTSIIDQNAEEVRKILEDKDARGGYSDRIVLEHHSNLTPEEESRRQSLLAQDWDAPVVFTTQVQFLEALFGAGTRSVRRMHQMANAVIILDEVQTLPINTIHLANLAFRFLVHACGASLVLSTATQPPLDELDNPYRSLIIGREQHMIQDEPELFQRLKRVEVFDRQKVGGWTSQEVAELAERQLHDRGSVLVVVNTKRSAVALYHAIAKRAIPGASLHHLSTNMCAVHRLATLNEIRTKLNNSERVICVSTQLIEAGVDIDFGAVIRYLAGLDSIAQSAGRCNRHGRHGDLGSVSIVNPSEENVGNLPAIQVGVQQTLRVFGEFDKDPGSFTNERIGLQTMAAYYRYYYYVRKDEMQYRIDAKSSLERNDDLFNLLSINTLSVKAYEQNHKATPDLAYLQSFQTAARAFRVIDSPTRGVVVQYGERGRDLAADLCAAVDLEKQIQLLRMAQRYSVNLFKHEFDKLAADGAIHETQAGTGVFYLDAHYYSESLGWSAEPVRDPATIIV